MAAPLPENERKRLAALGEYCILAADRQWFKAILGLDATETPRDNAFRVYGSDGQWHWQREDVRVDVVGPGRWRAAGVGIDITEQKNAEREVREA